MFPPEIVEKILIHCDGKTLRNARYVNRVWRQIVDYLTKETDIWKRCCLNDIPENERLQYFNKWIAGDDEDNQNKWLRVYENWLNWFDVRKNIEFETSVKGHHRRIACLEAAGRYIAVGFENGTVKVFDDNFGYIRKYRHLNIPICLVSMVCDDFTGEPTEMLIYYGDRVYIDDFSSNLYQPALFQDCFKFSSYKKFICGISHCGKITIAKITSDETHRIKSYFMVTYVRIYSPEIVTCCNLWDGVCTILVDNKVKTINYYDGIEGSLRSNVMANEKTRLEFSFSQSLYDTVRDIKMFNNNIIISLSKNLYSLNQQVFELYILGETKTHSKKMFIPWQTFSANITSMFLYGNTFLIGLSSGMVYFYEIHDWKLFDIANYSHMEHISHLAPVLSMDVIEFYGRRTFSIATSTKVYQVTGYSVPEIDNELETFLQIED